MKHSLSISKAVSCAFGILFLAIGLVNTFWGNDPIFGAGILVLSLIYFPPSEEFLEKMTRLQIPIIAKITLGLFILWAALGVGELFDKINLMQIDLGSVL